jgi:hypothetical protein
MAKDKGKSRTDINWILRDRKVIDGIELVSVNLYQTMLPGIPRPASTHLRPTRASRIRPFLRLRSQSDYKTGRNSNDVLRNCLRF